MGIWEYFICIWDQLIRDSLVLSISDTMWDAVCLGKRSLWEREREKKLWCWTALAIGKSSMWHMDNDKDAHQAAGHLSQLVNWPRTWKAWKIGNTVWITVFIKSLNCTTCMALPIILLLYAWKEATMHVSEMPLTPHICRTKMILTDAKLTLGQPSMWWACKTKWSYQLQLVCHDGPNNAAWLCRNGLFCCVAYLCVVIQTYSSQKDLGYCLLKKRQLPMCDPKESKPMKRNNWPLSLLYGKGNVTAETDCHPLVSISNNPLLRGPNWLQNHCLKVLYKQAWEADYALKQTKHLKTFG